MFNKTPKYNVNDIVIIDKDFSYEYGYSDVVGIIKDVFIHRDTGEVFYHIIFNSGTPRKLFEHKIKAKFDTGKFKDGQSIHKQLLAKMYHTNCYDYLSEEEIKKMINKAFGVPKFEYKKIIFSGPCTIILWKDGTKTIAKTSSDEEVFDPEKGVAICFMKKMLGHTETNKILRKASEQYEEYIAENRPNSSFDEFIDFCKEYFKSETKSVDHIDQSTIDEVKRVEEDQDD